MKKNMPLNIFMQAKGGVGKSVSAFIFAQYLSNKLGKENVNCLDTDPSNNSFSRYQELNVEYLNPTSTNANTGETKVDLVMTNAIFESIMNNNVAVIMDTGSSNYIDLKSYLEVNQTLEAFAEEEEIARDVYIHVPINGGVDFSFCCVELGKMAETFKTVKFIIWLNSYGGELKHDGNEFEDMKVAKMLHENEQLKGIVILPQLDVNQQKTFTEIMQSGLTFEQAKYDASGKINILKKRQIDRLRQNFYMQLDDIFPELCQAEA